jgi:hypothetical protein
MSDFRPCTEDALRVVAEDLQELRAELERLREENAELRDGLVVISCDDPGHEELARLQLDRHNAREFIVVAMRRGLIKPGTATALFGYVGQPEAPGATGGSA